MREGLLSSVVPRRAFLGRGAATLVLTLSMANVGTLAFHVAMTHLLNRTAYGPLVALIGVLTAVVVPIAAAGTAVTREVAVRKGAGDEIASIRTSTLRFGVVGVAGSVLVLATAPAARGYLHIGSATPIAVVGAVLVPTLLGVTPKSYLLGQGQFRPVTAALAAGVGTRLLAGVALAALGFGLTGAVAASLLAESVTCAMVLVASRPVLGPAPAGERGRLQLDLTGVALAVAACGGFWLLMAVDTTLAQHYLTHAAAGSYNAASTAANAAYFLPGAVALVAFPTFATSRGRGPDATRALGHTLLVVALLGTLMAGALAAFPNQAVGLVFGREYRGSAAAIRALAVSAAVAALVSVLMNFHLAARSRSALLTWPSLAFGFVAMGIWHRTPAQLANAVVLTNAVALATMLLAVRTAARQPVLADHPEPAMTAIAVS